MSEKTEPEAAKATKDSVNEATVAAPDETVSREELLELVRAIKFAKPNASIRNVHQEITQVLAATKGYEFLANVKLNDVKRVWKKAQQPVSKKDDGTSTAGSSSSKELLERLPEGVVQLYTVGDGSSVQTLARNYTAAAAAEVAAKEAQLEQRQEEVLKNYVHVFLDVPADRTGSRPHQALISFHKQEKKKGDESNKDNNIVKIQMAASMSEEDQQQYPLLLYNQDRSVKTFIHPDDDNDDTNCYERIQECISKTGVEGALGSMGGTKAYFNGFVTKRRKGPNIISINVSELAPAQEW